MDQHIIACPVLAQELEYILKEIHSEASVHLMDYSIHINADTMEQELQKNLNSCENEGNISLLVGRHCKARQPITSIAKQYGATLPQGQNCIEMILGHEQTKELQKNRTTIMTPGWIKMMNQSIKDGNWRVEDARINLGWYNQILLLDTGLSPLTDEIIMEFFELTEVPIDILKVDLTNFKKVVEKLLQKDENTTD